MNFEIPPQPEEASTKNNYEDIKFPIKKYEQPLSEIEKLEQAKEYWESRLGGEVRITTPQSPQCEFSIVVPVYNEDFSRIIKQIDSLRAQKIDPASFEIIYVVNNDLKNKSKEEVFDKNQYVINELKKITDFPVFVIDKSSSGNEISECNVGKARNRGVAEASLRFYENNRNGIIVQTDADTYFEDPDYISKLKKETTIEPDVIGIAGGVVFEFDPDSKDQKIITELQMKIDRLILMQKWSILKRFLESNTNYSPVNNNIFSGAHMISRSFESAVIGGLIDAPKGEDPRFGKDLEEYGLVHGQRVIGQKDTLRVITALRESDRTGASFKKVFDNINLSEPLEGKMPNTPKYSDFRQTMYKIFKNVNSDTEEIKKLREICLDSKGEALISEEALNEAIIHLQTTGFIDRDPFYQQWELKNHIGKDNEGFVNFLYRMKFHNIVITDESLRELSNLVLQKEGGDIVIENLNKVSNNIRLPEIGKNQEYR